jgi:adenylate kinase
MSDPRILILGPPGAGKGTQSTRIASAFGVEHVTTGDALRANKGMDVSDLDLEYDTPGAYMDRGELVPDPVVDAMVAEALSEVEGFVLDGYPRNAAQVETLGGITSLDVVLSLEVSHEELMDRLTGRRVCTDCGANYHVEYDPPAEAGTCDACGGDLYRREDDTPDAVETRIEEYDSQTAPVIEHYEATGDLVRIDGEAPPDQVWERIRTTIENGESD